MTDDMTRPVDTTGTIDAAPPIGAGAPVAPDSVLAAPVAVPTATPVRERAPGSNRTRWAIALGVAGFTVASAIGALLLLGSSASPEALRYIPSEAAVVVEVRMDLPGDQMQNLGNLLARFPGFADQSTLGDKIDEAMTKLVSGASDGKTDYRTTVKPWVNGPLFVGLLAPAGGLAGDGREAMVLSATTNGAVTCESVFEGEAVTRETYLNLELVLGDRGTAACVLDGRQALFGDPSTVRKALDAKAAGTGMDRSAGYKSARTALGADRLATVYANGTALQGLMPAPDSLGVPGLDGLTGALPAWMIGGVRAEDDAMVVDMIVAPSPASATGPSFLPMPAGHASVIAPMLPADTLAYVEIQGAGVGLQNLLTQLGSMPELAAVLQVLDGVGGAGELVGWVEDAGISVSMQDDSPNVALLLIATDEATATSTVTSLQSVLALAGLGGGVDVVETTVSGVAVTTITITDLGAMVPPGSVPGLGEIPVTGPISFSIAANGRAVLLTFGETAMSAILNVADGSSLVDQAAYKQAGAHGLANSQFAIYLAAGSTLDAVKGFVPPAELAAFETEVGPYLDPLEAVLVSGSNDASGSRSRIVITVSTP